MASSSHHRYQTDMASQSSSMAGYPVTAAVYSFPTSNGSHAFSYSQDDEAVPSFDQEHSNVTNQSLDQQQQLSNSSHTNNMLPPMSQTFLSQSFMNEGGMSYSQAPQETLSREESFSNVLMQLECGDEDNNIMTGIPSQEYPSSAQQQPNSFESISSSQVDYGFNSSSYQTSNISNNNSANSESLSFNSNFYLNTNPQNNDNHNNHDLMSENIAWLHSESSTQHQVSSLPSTFFSNPSHGSENNNNLNNHYHEVNHETHSTMNASLQESHTFDSSTSLSQSIITPTQEGQDPLVTQHAGYSFHNQVPPLQSLHPLSHHHLESTTESSQEYPTQSTSDLYSSLRITDTTFPDTESLLGMDSSDFLPTASHFHFHSQSMTDKIHPPLVLQNNNIPAASAVDTNPVKDFLKKDSSQESKKVKKIKVPKNMETSFEETKCLKCKLCSFLCLDKSQAKKHHRDVHAKPNKKKVKKDDSENCGQNSLPKAPSMSSLSITNISLPIVPQTAPVSLSVPVSSTPIAAQIPTPSSSASYVCQPCQKSFSSLPDCQAHMASEHNITQVVLQFSDNVFDHKSKVEGPSAPEVKLANKRTSNAAILPNAVQTETPTTSIDMEVKSSEILKKKKKCESRKKAWKAKQERELQSYTCEKPKCTIKFADYDNLQEHVKYHSDNEKGFACYHCNNFKNDFWQGMANHLWKKHGLDMELYRCDQCDYRSSSYSVLENTHKKTHSEEKNYICNECNKAFKNAKQLINHKVRHVKKPQGKTETDKVKEVKEYTHVCDLCGKQFPDARPLRIHMDMVHKKKRLHNCHLCDHSAATKGALRVHIRSHTGEKPFKCEECDYTTSDHNSLRRHKMRHSGERPYKCPFCDYACIQVRLFSVRLS